MGALIKRIGLGVVVCDLFVAGVASAALHHHSSGPRVDVAGRMSAARLEQIVEDSSGAANASCSIDPTAGWDYYCVSSDGSRTLYDVSADQVVQRSDLPSYR